MPKPHFTSAEIERLTGVKLVKPKASKYRSIKVANSRGKFDSKKEFMRFLELESLQSAGKISDLTRQVTFKLSDPVVLKGRKHPPIKIVVDYTYTRDGALVVEDCKSIATLTPAYRLKKKLLKEIHGLEIIEFI
jgi:hypothetical protein